MPKDEKEKLVPNLRFKGFTDDWIQCELKDVSAITMGQSPSSENYTSNPTDHILVQGNADLKEGRVFPRIWTTEVTKTAEPNDIILTVRAPVGDVALNDYNVVLGRGVSAIKGNYFVFQLLKRMNMRNYWKKYSTGSTFDSINSIDINTARVIVPNKSEQNYIGKMLTVLDNIITLEQEKLAHYHAMKKALSTSIFPKNNESLPNLNFNGDSGWKQQKLENFLSIPDKIKVEVTDTDEILSVKLNTNGVVGGESRSTLKLGATTYYRRDSGQFIYGKQNLFNGAMAIIPENLAGKVSSGDIPSLNISGINPNFLYEYLSRPYYYKQTEAMASGTGSKRIHEKTLLTFKIKVPNNDIQDNIEQLFTNLTALLDSQNNKVNKMIQIKKVLLNNLFV